MCSINVDGKIIQWISFKISETSFSSAEKRLHKCLRGLSSYKGWTQIYWSPNIKHQEVLNVFICWKTGADFEASASKPTFREVFSNLAVSPVESHYLDLKGTIDPGYPTEMVSFWFQQWLTEEEKTTFIENTNQAIDILIPRRLKAQYGLEAAAHLANVAQGWCYPKYISPSELEERNYSEFTYVVFMAPSGLKVRPEVNNILTNAVSPLLRTHSVVIEKAMYLNFETKTREELSRKCVFM